MGRRTLLSFFAIVNLGAASPITEKFFEWVAADKTTVLCSSTVPGSCDPFSDLAEGEEEFLTQASSTLELTPGRFFGSTNLPINVITSPDTQNYLRLRHTFEDEIDLGWYAFEGGTGDFLMEYSGGRDLQTAGYFDSVSFSFSSPFPLPPAGGFSEAIRTETFGQPIRLRGHHGVALDLLIQPDGICCGEHIIVLHGSAVGIARDLDLNPLEFDVRLAPVPNPEPGSLSMLGLIVILSAAAAGRRGLPIGVDRCSSATRSA